jgi:proline iminopeptidase
MPVEDPAPAGVASALSPGEHAISVDGLTQVYHVAGDGPVCVAHPGGPGVSWEYLRVPELELFLTMVYVEPIGTGGSDRLAPDGEGYRLDRYVRQVEGLVSHIGGPVYALGHSHGGFVMQRYALRNPSRVAGLIAYCTSPRWGAENRAEAARQLDLMAGRLAHRPGIGAVVKAWHDGYEPTDEGHTAFLRTILPAYFADYWANEEALAPLRDGLRAWRVPNGLDGFDDGEALRALSVPTLVLTARYDFICGPRWAAEMVAAVPGARLVTFQRSGHFVHLEDPEGFAGAVAGFVQPGPGTRRQP